MPVQGILSEVNDKYLEYGVLIACNPHYNKCLLVGAGPLGSFAAWRLSACGISDVTAKVQEPHRSIALDLSIFVCRTDTVAVTHTRLCLAVRCCRPLHKE